MYKAVIFRQFCVYNGSENGEIYELYSSKYTLSKRFLIKNVSWLQNAIVIPVWFKFFKSPERACVFCGSSADEGSSNKRICDSRTNVLAITTLCYYPSETTEVVWQQRLVQWLGILQKSLFSKGSTWAWF